MSFSCDAIVLGAGAAGLFCATFAGRRGRSVLVLERADKIGKKIRISGGGRCNFTNLHSSPENFLSQNPHFCRSALAGYTPADFVALVQKHGIPCHEKKLGRLFCDRTSEDVIRMLLAECAAAKAEIRLSCSVESLKHADGLFRVHTDQGGFQAPSLIVATGGLSIPKMGATPLGYEIARQFGMDVVPCRPALVPLTWGPRDLKIYGELAGVSMDVEARFGRGKFLEAMLFTHRGLSGPAILQISSYWEKGGEISLDLLPGKEVLAELLEGKKAKADLAAVLARHLPKRFAQVWSREEGPERALGELRDAEVRGISSRLHDWRVVPEGTEGYEKAEVTAGGVDTRGLSSKTMESKKVPGLYFIGEAVDVTGHLGGHNFQWAWASAAAAGRAVGG